MKTLKTLFATSLLVVSTSLFAHTGLTATAPADQAMLMAAPETIDLSFSSPVRLVKLEVLDSAKTAVKVDFKPSADLAATYSQVVPTLKPDTYTVNWTTMGKDAHKMSGNFSFMVH